MRGLALAVCLFTVAALPATALDRSAFSFTHYDLRVTLDPHQHGLAVEGTVELRNVSERSQGEVVLQISSSLRWRSVGGEGGAVEWLEQSYTSDIDHTGLLHEAIVKLEKPLAPGESLRLRVRYSGTVSKDATRLERIGTPANVARRSDWDEISDGFTALRGAGFVVWYPVSMDAANLSQGTELFEILRGWRQREASATLRLHVSRVAPPEGDESRFTFVTNGSEGKTGVAIDDEFRGVEPVIVLLADPAETTNRPHVEAYYTAPHTNLARDYMAAAEAVIPPLEQWFGSPRRKVVVVELTDPNALPYDAGAYYFVPLRAVPHGAAEVALARPMVHAMLDSPRPWIREGLANFGQALVRERQAGRRAAIAYMGQFGSALAEAEAESHPASTSDSSGQSHTLQTPTGTTAVQSHSLPTRLEGSSGQSQSMLADGEASAAKAPSFGSQSLITTADEVFFRTKAAYVWWMLRDMVGDSALQSALAKYRPAEDRSAAYMQQLIEKQLTAKRDLEPFFDDWVYRDRGLPQLRADSAYVRQTLEERTVTAVTIENLGDAWCEVPVAVRSAKGENSVRVIVPGKSKVTVRVPLEAAPSAAEVNDGSVPEAEHRDNMIPIVSAPSPTR